MSEQPAAKFRDGRLEVAVWANQTNDDEPKTSYSLTLERSYKDGDDWKKTSSLNGDDTLKAAHLLTKAHDAILELRRAY